MAKPILVIKLPNGITRKEMNEITEEIQKKMTDWHIMVISCDVRDVTFEAYSNEQAPDIEIEELKKMINEHITI